MANLTIKVAVPKVATGTITGDSGEGIFTPTPLTGTTITSAPVGSATKDKYKNGNEIDGTYTLRKD